MESANKKPGKPILSPTKIGVYLSCQMLYKLVYVDKLGRFYKPKFYHSFGSSLHRALSDFHSVGGSEIETADQLVSRLRERWVPLGYNSAADEQEHLEIAAATLAEYHSAHTEPGEKTLLVERQLKSDMGDFILAGRVDRLVELADGTINIIDYKSGRETVSEDDIRKDLAMGIYQLLASKNYPDRAITATIYCLRTNVKATARLSTSELEELEDEICAIAADMLNIDAETIIEPIRKELCAACDYIHRCSRIARLSGETWD